NPSPPESRMTAVAESKALASPPKRVPPRRPRPHPRCAGRRRSIAGRFRSMLTVLTLSSGRSGTHFLYQLIRRNALDCVARHETYGFNPSMFGRPIYDYAVGKRERTRRLLDRKRSIIERCGAAAYVETSNAFLKSWPDLASEYFPQSKFVHLIRDPLKVAKSEADREQLIKWLHVPLCHYH